MKNKILIKVYIPAIDEEYEIFIPVNETVKKIVELTVKSVYEISGNLLNQDYYYHLIDPVTSTIYSEVSIIRETNIKNSSRIVLL